MRYSNNDLKPKTEWEKTKRMTNNVQMANKTAIKMNGNNNKKQKKSLRCARKFSPLVVAFAR